MVRKLRTIVLLSLFGLFSMVSAPLIAYGYFDQLNSMKSETIPVGYWDFVMADPYTIVDEELITAFTNLYGVESLEELYQNPVFQTLMDAASKTTTGGSSYTEQGYILQDVLVGGIHWDIQGVSVTSSGNASLGFVRQINRELNSSGSLIHAVIPQATATPLPYPEYNYFVASDVRNSLTNNTYGFRLDYQVAMTTNDPIANLSGISFYAIRGLLSSSSEKMSDRTFVVQVSPTGEEGSFVNVGSTKTSTSVPVANEVFDPANPLSYPFPYYEFNLSADQISSMPAAGYYVRIVFDGGVSGNGSKATRSRLVIDDLKINQLG